MGIPLAARILTMPGDEIARSYGKSQWGHFNVYPTWLSRRARPRTSVAPYFDLDPAAIVAVARFKAGARILEANHGRMDPRIGYFDSLTHLDARTGAADGTFRGNFDAVEAFNGFWVTNPAKVCDGAVDSSRSRAAGPVSRRPATANRTTCSTRRRAMRAITCTSARPIATAVRVFSAIRRGTRR